MFILVHLKFLKSSFISTIEGYEVEQDSSRSHPLLLEFGQNIFLLHFVYDPCFVVVRSSLQNLLSSTSTNFGAIKLATGPSITGMQKEQKEDRILRCPHRKAGYHKHHGAKFQRNCLTMSVCGATINESFESSGFYLNKSRAFSFLPRWKDM